MRARTLEGGEVDLSEAAIAGVKARLQGQVCAGGHDGYEECRTVWNGMIDRRPALVVRCLGTADVVSGARFAREHQLLLCIKGGGHNIAGLATADGALMLDLSLMRSVCLDPKVKAAKDPRGSVRRSERGSRGWPRSRPGGIRRTCSGRTGTSFQPDGRRRGPRTSRTDPPERRRTHNLVGLR
jgi:hypothetical protein